MSTGMVHITWSSLNVGIFLRRVEEAIVQFEIFTKQVHYVHINECAITYMMKEISLHYTCTVHIQMQTQHVLVLPLLIPPPVTRCVTCMSVVSRQTWLQ